MKVSHCLFVIFIQPESNNAFILYLIAQGVYEMWTLARKGYMKYTWSHKGYMKCELMHRRGIWNAHDCTTGIWIFYALLTRNMSTCIAVSNQSDCGILVQYRISKYIHLSWHKKQRRDNYRLITNELQHWGIKTVKVSWPSWFYCLIWLQCLR